MGAAMNRILDRSMLVGIGLVVALLALNAGLAYHNTRQLREDAGWVDHTHEVLDLTSDVLQALVDAETGERGFLLTRRDEFLRPYHAAVARLPERMAQLKDKTKDDPRRQDQIQQLEAMTAARLALLKERIDLRRKRERDTEALDAAKKGMEQMDAIRGLVATMEQEERALLKEREQRSSRAYQIAVSSGLFAAFLGLVFVGAFVGLLARSLSARQKAAAALDAQREWLRTTLASIGDGVVATDPQGRVLLLNSVAAALTGWEEDAAKGLPLTKVFQIVNEQSREPAENPVVKVLRAGTVVGLANHTLLLAKDGTEWPIDDSAAPIRGAGGDLAGVVLIFRDVTERRRAEAVLRESEAKYRHIVETANEGIWLLDAEARVTFVNRRMADLLGFRPEEMVGRFKWDFLFEEDQARVRALFERRQAGVSEQADVRFRHHSGREVWTIMAARPVNDDQGTFRGALDLFTDVTERRRAEETVRALLRISTKLNSTLDVDQLLDLLVQEALLLVGAESGVSGLCTPQGMVCHRYFQQGKAVPLEYCWPALHGLPGWLLVHKVPYLTNDALADTQIVRELCVQLGVRTALSTPVLNARREVLGFFEVHNKRDGSGFTPSDQELLVALSQAAAIAIQNALAYRKVQQAEAALQEADRRKDEFLAMLAHELRNPLAPIRNALQVMSMRGITDPALRQVRDMIGRQVNHLTRLVNDLLEVGRMIRGKIELRKERLDLVRLVRHAVEDQQSAFEQAGLRVHVALPELPVWVMADDTRLTQALDNLLQNAGKFTERGGQVSVRLAVQDQRAEVAVKDTGIGIESKMLPIIFEPFTQADRSLDRSRGGLGVGLSLVKRLVEMHGGEVHAFSEGPGRGAEFLIRLAVEPEPAALTDIPVAPARAAKHLRVLVVEDNRDAADSLRMLLELYGYEVAVAYSGPEGVKAALQWHPDVVLCDIGLPGLSGYEVAGQLRSNPTTACARLIAVTGYGQEEDRRRSKEVGFDNHLVKPVDPMTLQGVLSQAPAGS
jgi:PAS domain S-box-containing protein